jgi:hypothetical protein
MTNNMIADILTKPLGFIKVAIRDGLWISAIRWRISASANGYPPADADVPFPLKSWRISAHIGGKKRKKHKNKNKIK